MQQAGCVHFNQQTSTSACDIRVLILFYSVDKKAYLGFIPNNQVRNELYSFRMQPQFYDLNLFQSLDLWNVCVR